mgnify:FL=1
MSVYQLETEEDMASYFDIEAHGRAAIFVDTNNSSTNIEVIFNNEFIEQDEGVGVEARQPIAYCRSSQVPGITYGNQIQISAEVIEGFTISPVQNYKVVSVQSNNDGFVSLELEII